MAASGIKRKKLIEHAGSVVVPSWQNGRGVNTHDPIILQAI